jgi:hypothetical protein
LAGKSCQELAALFRDYFSVYFEHDAWNNFFLCSISFLTQQSLQLEQFSQMKRNKISARYTFHDVLIIFSKFSGSFADPGNFDTGPDPQIRISD